MRGKYGTASYGNRNGDNLFNPDLTLEAKGWYQLSGMK